MEQTTIARQMWKVLEPLHALIYYAPEAFEVAAALGFAVDTRWQSYFAWRASPLGAAGPRLSTALFYSFAPKMVADYIPGVWLTASPDDVLVARDKAADRSLRRLLGDHVNSPAMAEAAKIARRAAIGASLTGRPLAAANAELSWPAEPHMGLWRAATILREHRGDGHIAALLAADLDPCESLVSLAATGAAPSEVFASRGWGSKRWNEARMRLVQRQWVNKDGVATDIGHEGRAEVEKKTDELASSPWMIIGSESTARLAALLAPMTRIIAASGILPTQSTLGMSYPALQK